MKVSVWLDKELSTPHGTLGTVIPEHLHATIEYLSTPHGTLGTENAYGRFTSMKLFQLHTVH